MYYNYQDKMAVDSSNLMENQQLGCFTNGLSIVFPPFIKFAGK